MHAVVVTAHATIRGGAMAAVIVAIGARPVGIMTAQAVAIAHPTAPIAVRPGPAVALPGPLVFARPVVLVAGEDPLVLVVARLVAGDGTTAAMGVAMAASAQGVVMAEPMRWLDDRAVALNGATIALLARRPAMGRGGKRRQGQRRAAG